MTAFEARMFVFLGAIGAGLIWIIPHRHIPAKTPAHEKLAPRRLKPRTADGWRVYYHFARPHTSLLVHATERAGRLQRQRFQTPAQAAGLTNHRWIVKELLSFPLPKTAC